MRIYPISAGELADMRRRSLGREHVAVSASGGEPLRCCLRDATEGERLLLTSYTVPSVPSPYIETGAVYIHQQDAPCRALVDSFPAMSLRREQVVRAYDSRGWIVGAELAEIGRAEAVVAELLNAPGAVHVDVRNPKHGCFMFRVTAD